jgi:uncharacterized membrane protein YhaH (DUF805 family)
MENINIDKVDDSSEIDVRKKSIFLKIFQGRIGRLDYLLYCILAFLIIYFLTAYTLDLLSKRYDNPPDLYIIISSYFVFIFLIIIGAVKRLHDIDWSGFWALLIPVPVYWLIITFILLFKKGTNGSNKYGMINDSRNIFKRFLNFGNAEIEINKPIIVQNNFIYNKKNDEINNRKDDRLKLIIKIIAIFLIIDVIARGFISVFGIYGSVVIIIMGGNIHYFLKLIFYYGLPPLIGFISIFLGSLSLLNYKKRGIRLILLGLIIIFIFVLIAYFFGDSTEPKPKPFELIVNYNVILTIILAIIFSNKFLGKYLS